MTEDEMKKTWCPYRFYPENAPDGRCVTGNTKSTCVGSRCSQWRWRKEKQVTSTGGFVGIEISRTNGYCGRAGKP